MGVNLNINALIKQLGKFWTVLIILIVGAAAYFIFVYRKPVSCATCEKEKLVLVQLLLDVKKDIGTMLPTAYEHRESYLVASVFFALDTVPKVILTLQQRKLDSIAKKIDSVLRKMKKAS